MDLGGKAGGPRSGSPHYMGMSAALHDATYTEGGGNAQGVLAFDEIGLHNTPRNDLMKQSVADGHDDHSNGAFVMVETYQVSGTVHRRSHNLGAWHYRTVRRARGAACAAVLPGMGIN